MIRERDVERYFVKLCKARGWMCLKFTSPGLRGVPDRLVLFRLHGRAEFVELKAPGGRLSPAQERCHARLRERHFVVSVLSSQAEVNAWAAPHYLRE